MNPEVTLQAIKSIVTEAVEASEFRIATTTSRGFDRLESRMSNLENRMDGLEDRMDGLEDCMSGLEDRMSGVEDRTGGIEHRLSNIEIELHGVRTQGNRIEVVLSQKIPIIEHDIVDVRTRITKLEVQHS
jgi:chromosome segregation ATPase